MFAFAKHLENLTNQELMEWADRRVVEDTVNLTGNYEHWIKLETEEVDLLGEDHQSDALRKALLKAVPDLSLDSPVEVERYCNLINNDFRCFVEQNGVRQQVSPWRATEISKAAGDYEAVVFYLEKHYGGASPNEIRDMDAELRREQGFDLIDVDDIEGLQEPVESADLDSLER